MLLLSNGAAACVLGSPRALIKSIGVGWRGAVSVVVGVCGKAVAACAMRLVAWTMAGVVRATVAPGDKFPVEPCMFKVSSRSVRSPLSLLDPSEFKSMVGLSLRIPNTYFLHLNADTLGSGRRVTVDGWIVSNQE